MKTETSAGAVVFRKDMEIKYLLMHKPTTKGFHGYWGFVKGIIEDKEDERDTVLRELKEEAGIIEAKFIENFHNETHFFYMRDNKLISKKVRYMVLQVRTKDIKLSKEHDDYGWYGYEEALYKLKFKNDREILKKVNVFLNN